MVDDLFDRDYQAGRRALNAEIANFIARLGAAAANAFNVLNRIEYSEPWAASSKGTRFN
ncbi:MAG TPA: hypothetical protein VE968_07040 [Sphingomicrobium sp.]|nr:hypothetical protein [Sphingomicrobium sp.]